MRPRSQMRAWDMVVLSIDVLHFCSACYAFSTASSHDRSIRATSGDCDENAYSQAG